MKIRQALFVSFAFSFATFAVLTPFTAHAQEFFDTPQNFVVSTECKAHTSIRKKTNPVSLTIGQGYTAFAENKASEATHAFIEVEGKRKWVALTCGQYDGNGGNATDCLPFFDDKENPQNIPGFGVVDVTPPAPVILPFGRAVNEVCGAPGKRVSEDEFKTLLSSHPEVLARLKTFTGGRVFADRPVATSSETYLEELADAWFAIDGFNHIFCGEPEPGGSIGGFHFRGRYLQLQETGLACRLANNLDNEEVVPGSIYTVGVAMQVDGGIAQKDVKGYGLTFSAEDLLKVVTRAFADNPTPSDSSEGCLLNVEDDSERFVTVFVRRKNGIRTFFPDATPDPQRNPACIAYMTLPASVPADR